MSKWVVSQKDLNISKREPGISGFIRARNEGDWLALTIESHLPFLDEIIVVYNRCNDNTAEIANEYASKHPKKVKVFHYEPIVYPQGSQKCIDLPVTSPHSLVNYYNYALCKTTKCFALKVDGDQIAIPSVYTDMIRSFRKSYKNRWYKFKGINLWDHDGEIFIKRDESETCFDRGFFRVCPGCWHHLDKKRGLEILKMPQKSQNYPHHAYYHTKGMKKDRGIQNYDLDSNPKSRYHGVVKQYYTAPRLMSLAAFRKKYTPDTYLPSPGSLGIKPLTRDS
jgi:hypothetical protein